ncbi:MAG TPA: efflux RND transporter periplasmic adaptor subunit [Acidobacteriota bacterium]|nr:efflux RND transporter periplasmic adaptor subunit [Acidobacteriota bacterium]
MTKKKKKTLIIGGGILVILILVVVNLTSSREATTKVAVGKVKEGKLTSQVSASGKVQPRTEVKISANVSGEIVDIPVVEGQAVSKGDLLVQIDPKNYDAVLRQAQAGYDAGVANLRLEEAQVSEAEPSFERQKALFEKNLTSKETYDVALARVTTARASAEAARSRMLQAKAAVDQANENLRYTTIRCPIDGYVTDLRSEIGEIVMGSQNYQATVIMVVSDLSEIEVEIEVDETDIAAVALDQDVDIGLDAVRDTTFKGRVVQVGNTAKVSGLGSQDQVTNFMVTVLITDSVPNIKPGMTATCDITTDSRDKALNVPIGAVVLRDESRLKNKEKEGDKEDGSGAVSEAVAADADEDATASADTTAGTDAEDEKTEVKKKPLEGVFVVRDGKAVFVAVVTGIADQQNIEIASGLEKDEEIVVGPFRTLRQLDDGDAVEPESGKSDD